MEDKKWDQYAQLVLKGIENAESCGKEHESRLSRIENKLGNIETALKIVSALLVPLLLEAISSFIGGR